jgi:hypothetical protein
VLASQMQGPEFNPQSCQKYIYMLFFFQIPIGNAVYTDSVSFPTDAEKGVDKSCKSLGRGGS